jgi:hypothetical protein
MLNINKLAELFKLCILGLENSIFCITRRMYYPDWEHGDSLRTPRRYPVAPFYTLSLKNRHGLELSTSVIAGLISYGSG